MKKLVLIIGVLVLALNTWSQTAPVVDNVEILGAAYYNISTNDATILTGTYNYSDADGDAEGTSIYQWYRDGVAIAGANEIRYTIQLNDVSTTITFGVTPVDTDPETGIEYVSPTGISSTSTTISDALKSNATDNSGGTIPYLNLQIKNNKYYTVDNGTTVYIYGDLSKETGIGAQHVTFNIQGNSTVIVYGQFIAVDLMTINVENGSTFTIVSGVDARDGAVLDIDGSLTVNGDLIVDDNATFNIADGGNLAIDGDLVAGDDASIDVEGNVTIGGDLSVGARAEIIVDSLPPTGGTLIIEGDLNGDASTEILGSGSITVGGTIDPDIVDTGNSQLPIELTYFNAVYNTNTVTVTWQTASETNNAYFTIERSINGTNFEILGTVQGAGNSYTKLNYSFTDYNPVQGISYYRLKQTDYNGAFEVFKPVSVVHLEEGDLQIGPNPTSDYLNVMIDGTMGKGTLYIFNMVGAKVLELNLINSFTTIDINDLPSGNYMLKISADTINISRRIVIQ